MSVNEHGGEHALARSGAPAGQELLDLVEDRVAVSRPRDLIGAGQLDVLAPAMCSPR